MDGYLHLKNGESYKGIWLTECPQNEIEGEIVFYTGMTGYQEVLTDPSYKDQIIVFTYPLIGNYGINEQDFESKQPHAAGVIVYESIDSTGHYEAKYSLKEYLQKWKIPMLGHIDTRAVVKKIRDFGTMPAVLSDKKEKKHLKFMLNTSQKVCKVSRPKIRSYGKGDIHIVLIDFGFKKSILASLLKRNCRVTTVPYNTSFETIEQLNPDGILLSNGPGDPKDLSAILPILNQLLKEYPVFGICLGHQLAALALGADTKKLPFGHRGANHPIMDLKRKTVFMSSQNHSYVVDEKSLTGTGLKARFYNLHDQSIEGLVHEHLPVQTVQFHPEANPGPNDADYLFDDFIDMVKANNGREIAYA